MAGATSRLDNFTDAAFAFALSLLVIGSNAAPTGLAQLRAAMADVPTFAIGFAIIALFWTAHLRWRRLRGEGGLASRLLTLVLVFLVLVYVRPLQGMALSLSAYLGGSGTRFSGDLGDLFFIYGAGFAAMSLAVAGLFLDANRDQGLGAAARREALGESLIWGVCALTGLISMLLTLTGTDHRAPWVYATLPISIPLAAWLFPWEPRGADPV
jgi:uncharacterized membrane protein